MIANIKRIYTDSYEEFSHCVRQKPLIMEVEITECSSDITKLFNIENFGYVLEQAILIAKLENNI